MRSDSIQAILEIWMILAVSYRIRQRKMRFSGKLCVVFALDLFILGAVNLRYVHMSALNVIYVALFLFCRSEFEERARDTGWRLLAALLLCSVLQLILYYPCFWALRLWKLQEYSGILVNLTGVTLVLSYRNAGLLFERENWVLLKEDKGILVLILFSLAMLALMIGFRRSLYIGDIESAAVILFSVTLCIAILQWNARLRETLRDKKELEMVKKYNAAYAELLDAVRIRQHDFNNHLNAMLGIAFTADSKEELLEKQQEFCGLAANSNQLAKLLNSCHSLIAGMLYVKVQQAEQKRCTVKYRISSTKTEFQMENIDIIELLGILFDNAMEEEQKYEDAKRAIYFELADEGQGVAFRIGNRVEERLGFAEISAMFEKGKSGKGSGRGIGLYKAKEIMRKYEAEICVECVEQGKEVFIQFKIMLI